MPQERIYRWQYSNYLEIIGKRKGTLYSSELLQIYPDDFENYENEILIYQKFMQESEFRELLFDGV